jgi:hypothetical protein
VLLEFAYRDKKSYPVSLLPAFSLLRRFTNRNWKVKKSYARPDKIFCTLVESPNFTKAANACGVEISQRCHEQSGLEQELVQIAAENAGGRD